jgi:hypothetical protein
MVKDPDKSPKVTKFPFSVLTMNGTLINNGRNYSSIPPDSQ